jgi:hypothetical protein
MISRGRYRKFLLNKILPFVSPMLDYSTDGRVCKAGMTSKDRCETLFIIRIDHSTSL